MNARRKIGFVLLGLLVLATAILVWEANWNRIEQHAAAIIRGTHATAAPVEPPARPDMRDSFDMSSPAQNA